MFTAELDQTIAAVASAPGGAGRGIVRVSGGDAVALVHQLFEPGETDAEPASTISYRAAGTVTVSDFPQVPADAWVWPTARSYTGQPMVELHLPGSPPLLERVLETLFEHGVRPARAGEFTLRAFLAGRMDLAQAEAVLGVIDADDHEELTTALNQLAGGLSGKLLQLRGDLLELLADLEAGLDFVEEDIEFVSRKEVMRRLQSGIDVIRQLEQQADGRMLADDRLRVVLAGLPNAGKSTLFNALSKSDDAIVSSVAGTTRDYLASKVSCGELTIELIDTAGLDRSESGIDGAAQKLGGIQVGEADLVLWCSAVDNSDEDRAADLDALADLKSRHDRVVAIKTRGDLRTTASDRKELDAPMVSAVSGEGLDELRELIAGLLSERSQGERQFVGSTAARSRDSLRRASESLLRAFDAADGSLGDELVAFETRTGIETLGEIVGTIYTDDLLDQIFSRFCIGK
ncbi:MAG: tRNA modification GTPase [Planctomycetota bacterium]|nr:tRNA modification GTPase [Planctomycetota bacterium]MDA0918728.1 tRNA modification GTPase [Planctomycetota bacterium]MDA1159544.1 tRNA modification GTPase [Planctomycetota bacterium]